MENKTLLLVSNDIELYNKIDGLKVFAKLDIQNDFNSVNDYDIVLVSDRLLSFNNFLDSYRTHLKNVKSLFYMVSNHSEHNINHIKAILDAKNVRIIPPRKTVNQIIEIILEETGGISLTSKNIAAFFGADSKTGTTITTQAIAETLAKGMHGNVCLMYLNGQPAYDYINFENSPALGLDNIKVKLINKVLTKNELIDTCVNKDNLYILTGAEGIAETRHYHPDHVEYLIELASKHFSALLIDTGCKLQLGMSIGALNTTNNRYIITTQQDNAKRNFDRTKTQLFSQLGFDVKDFLLIVNKYIETPELYTPSQLAELYGCTLAGTLPYLDYGWQSERDRNTLLGYSKAYDSQVEDIAKVIACQLGLDYTANANNESNVIKGAFRWLKKR